MKMCFLILAVAAVPAAWVAGIAAETAATTPAKTTASTEPTVVTSERSSMDYVNGSWTFEGNVLAVDPRITVRADKMIAFFGSTNNIAGETTNAVRSVHKIIAEGSVVITTPDDKVSHSDHAVYTATDGKVVLTGNPRVQSPEGTVTGKKITFWRNQSKMDVESDQTDTNRTRLIIYPEEPKKKSEGADRQP
jgi:lipopolysaccharide transport protein LptA